MQCDVAMSNSQLSFPFAGKKNTRRRKSNASLPTEHRSERLTGQGPGQSATLSGSVVMNDAEKVTEENMESRKRCTISAFPMNGSECRKEKEETKGANSFMSFLRRGFSSRRNRHRKQKAHTEGSIFDALQTASDMQSQFSKYIAMEKLSVSVSSTSTISVQPSFCPSEDAGWTQYNTMNGTHSDSNHSIMLIGLPNRFSHSTTDLENRQLHQYHHPPTQTTLQSQPKQCSDTIGSLQLYQRPPRPTYKPMTPSTSLATGLPPSSINTPCQSTNEVGDWIESNNRRPLLRRPRTPTLGRAALLFRMSGAHGERLDSSGLSTMWPVTNSELQFGVQAVATAESRYCHQAPRGSGPFPSTVCGMSRSTSLHSDLRDNRIDSNTCSTSTLTRIRGATPTNAMDDVLKSPRRDPGNRHAYDTVALDPFLDNEIMQTRVPFIDESMNDNSSFVQIAHASTPTTPKATIDKRPKSIVLPANRSYSLHSNVYANREGDMKLENKVSNKTTQVMPSVSMTPKTRPGDVPIEKKMNDTGQRIPQTRLPILCRTEGISNGTQPYNDPNKEENSESCKKRQERKKSMLSPKSSHHVRRKFSLPNGSNSPITASCGVPPSDMGASTTDDRMSRSKKIQLNGSDCELQHPKQVNNRKKDQRQSNLQDSVEQVIEIPVGAITLRRRTKPELENERYRDISLRLSVQEVKNVSVKGRYFCEICLDRTLYARTTSKQSDGTVFWGEKFELNNLPEISIITINLYRQGGGQTKEKRNRNPKGPNQFVAFVTVPLADLPVSGSEYQQWLTMQSPQITPYLLTLDQSNWTSPPNSAKRPGDSIQRVGSTHNSPSANRFRNRFMPAACFRHSTSASAFPICSDETRTGVSAIPNAVGSNQTSLVENKKHSWTAGVGCSTVEIPSQHSQPQHGKHRKASYSNVSVKSQPPTAVGKSVSGSSNISPSYRSCKTSFSLPENPLPQIRLNLLYESIDVLPLDYYIDLREFLRTHSITLIRYLEPQLSAKQKEELASCFVNIHEKLPDFSVVSLLTALLEEDVSQNTNGSMLFRSNSTGSKAVECYMKLVGSEYLRHVLKGFIDTILGSSDDFEVDPSRLQSKDSSSNNNSNNCDNHAQVEKNCAALLHHLNSLWQSILTSLDDLPLELRAVFSSLRGLLERTHGRKTSIQLISSCLFLRFLCPAIHGPVLFGLTTAVPESTRLCRNLTLIAKVLQNLANLAIFEEKEMHMKRFNNFLEHEINSMQHYLTTISTKPENWTEENTEESDSHECHMFIDIGYEFAKIASLLFTYVKSSNLPPELVHLPDILQYIHEHTTDTILSSWTTDATACRRFTSGDASSNQMPAWPQRPRYNSTDDGTQKTTSTTRFGEYSMRSSLDSSVKSLSRKSSDQLSEDAIAPSPLHVSKFPNQIADVASTNGDHLQVCLESDSAFSTTPDGHSSTLPDDRNMMELLGQYQEQLRELHACIDQVNGTSNPLSPSQPEFGLPIDRAADEWATVNALNTTNSIADRDIRDDASDYEFGDRTDGEMCQSEPLEIQSRAIVAPVSESGCLGGENACMRQNSLSESPSLDQLADRLQEMRILLKHERDELSQVVAKKTRVIRAREHSIEQLTTELDQLRRAPSLSSSSNCSGNRNRFASALPNYPRKTPATISPSSSNSSECFAFNHSPEDNPPPTNNAPHCNGATFSPMPVTYNDPVQGHNSRSQSFRGHTAFQIGNSQMPISMNGHANPVGGLRYGPNLLDLSRASEGTGIPLGDLIVTRHNNRTPRRRFSESKIPPQS